MEHGGTSSISTSLTHCLHAEELLLDSSEITKVLTDVKLMMNQFLILTIMPTEGCNFRCPYCYESHKTVFMNQEIIEKIKLYLSEQCGGFKTVCINWFGGEPTLCPDMILNVATHVQALQKRYDFIYRSAMTTNGYLLTKGLFVKLYAVGIASYQITLDGRNHDKTRPLASGEGTLSTIMSNLRAISALPKDEYHFNITIRHNILAGDEDFSWYDYLLENFGGDERFNVMVRAVGDWGGDSVKNLQLLSSGDRNALTLRHIDYIKKIGLKCKNSFEGTFSKICYASYPYSMVIRADGRIEKCTVALNHPSNQIGTVSAEDGVHIDAIANRAWWSNTLPNKCFSCKSVLSCLNLRCRKDAVTGNSSEPDCSEDNLLIY